MFRPVSNKLVWEQVSLLVHDQGGWVSGANGAPNLLPVWRISSLKSHFQILKWQWAQAGPVELPGQLKTCFWDTDYISGNNKNVRGSARRVQEPQSPQFVNFFLLWFWRDTVKTHPFNGISPLGESTLNCYLGRRAKIENVWLKRLQKFIRWPNSLCQNLKLTSSDAGIRLPKKIVRIKQIIVALQKAQMLEWCLQPIWNVLQKSKTI